MSIYRLVLSSCPDAAAKLYGRLGQVARLAQFGHVSYVRDRFAGVSEAETSHRSSSRLTEDLKPVDTGG